MAGRRRVAMRENVHVLPDELVLEVFDKLSSAKDRGSISLVCKRWYYLEAFTRKHMKIGLSSEEERLPRLLERFQNLESIEVDDTLHTPRFCSNGASRAAKSFSEPKSRRRPSASGRSEARGVGGRAWLLPDPAEHEREFSGLTDAGILELSKHCPKLEKLSLIWSVGISTLGYKELAQQCKNLKTINFQGCFLNDDALTTVGEFCLLLEDISFVTCDAITDRGLCAVARSRGSTLRSFQLENCPLVTGASLEEFGQRCPNLQEAVIRTELDMSEGLCTLGSRCTNLEVFKVFVGGAMAIDAVVEVVTHNCRRLRSLHVHCKSLTAVGLRAIASSCENLVELSIGDSQSISDAELAVVAQQNRRLRLLELERCDSLGNVALEQFTAMCRNLESIRLRYCWSLQDTALLQVSSCPSLRDLRIVSCPVSNEGLAHVAKQCPNLRLLELCNCGIVGDLGLSAIGAHCPGLEDLSVFRCASVSSVGIDAVGRGCPQLRSLNTCGCPLVDDTGLEAIGRGCPLLTNLTISRCQRVGDTGLIAIASGCPDLRTLSMSDCQSITDTGMFAIAQGCRKIDTLALALCSNVTSRAITSLVANLPLVNRLVVEPTKITERTQRRSGSFVPANAFL